MLQKIKKHLGFNDLLFLGALFVALALVWNTVTAMQRNYHLQQKQNQLAAEIELLKLENENIKYNIAYRKTNDYLELASRKKFAKANPGENLVYLPGAGAENKVAVIKSKTQPKISVKEGWRSNVNAWWRFIKGETLGVKS